MPHAAGGGETDHPVHQRPHHAHLEHGERQFDEGVADDVGGGGVKTGGPVLVKDVALGEGRRDAGHPAEADDHHDREAAPYLRRHLVERVQSQTTRQ